MNQNFLKLWIFVVLTFPAMGFSSMCLEALKEANLFRQTELEGMMSKLDRARSYYGSNFVDAYQYENGHVLFCVSSRTFDFSPYPYEDFVLVARDFRAIADRIVSYANLPAICASIPEEDGEKIKTIISENVKVKSEMQHASSEYEAWAHSNKNYETDGCTVLTSFANQYMTARNFKNRLYNQK